MYTKKMYRNTNNFGRSVGTQKKVFSYQKKKQSFFIFLQ